MKPSRIALIPAYSYTIILSEKEHVVVIKSVNGIGKKKKKTLVVGTGVSKSGSPAARQMTGTPDWKRAVARSLMASVLEGFN